MSLKIEETHNNFLIVKGVGLFVRGLLFPHNIVYDGTEISLPFAMDVMRRLREDESLLTNVGIVSRFGDDDENAIISFDCKAIYDIPENEMPFSDNMIYEGKIVAKTRTATVVSVNGYYGFIDTPTEKKIDETVCVTVMQKSNGRLNFSQFCIVDKPVENLESRYTTETIDKFLTKEELAAIDDTGKAEIEWVLENIDGINRGNINVVREVLHLTYNPHIQSDMVRFLTEHPHYFTENNFWIGAYRDAETNDVKLIIYDSNDVVLEVLVNNTGFWVQDFSHDRNKTNAQYLVNCNQKALVVSGTNIVVHENGYLCGENISVGEKIINQLKVAKDILPGLKREIKSLKEKAGIEYLTLKEYLSYQEKKERAYNEKNSIAISANEAIVTSTETGRTALLIKDSPNVSSLFTETDRDTCYIEIECDSDNKINAELKTNDEDGGYIIAFYNEHLDIDGLRKKGFSIRRRASVKHLTLQKRAIDDFVYGYGENEIFEKLNLGKLIPPSPCEDIVFFDEKFSYAEEGNNQPLAIKKAVNNNDIFLIQGPPGTGKTSIIVEIIKQLVINRNEKVLVCSQAHSAVKNIYDRLIDADERIKIGNIDESATMIPEDLKEHPEFLKNNTLLLSALEKRKAEENVWSEKSKYVDYKSSSKDMFIDRHEYICNYYEQNKPDNTSEWIDILSELRRGLEDLGDDAIAFNNARHYQSLNVVMGTCIGIGLDLGLQHSGVVFDTVIIDEAGKANLSETTVPMKLGRKYILVGDNKQLPPYMDSGDIEDFVSASNDMNLSKKEVGSAIGSSLFEDFLEDSKFPAESSVLLNYQYRMNPAIGDCISKLFYGESLKNGSGTEKQVCSLESFPSAVTFIDTSGSRKAYEQGNSTDGYYNQEEIDIFKERLLPRILRLKTEVPNISVGIITPYRRQRMLLMKETRETVLSDSVYTIDSIQGSEFDVVVLSLVRAFKACDGKTVGFLDDMRRLNVALSRAKKKLVIIGHLDTLCNEKAHRNTDIAMGVKPVEVFHKMRLIRDRTAEKTSLDLLKGEMDSGRLKEGDVFKNCSWRVDENSEKKAFVDITLNGTGHTFTIPYSKALRFYGSNCDKIDVRFDGIGEKGWALFEYLPNVSMAQMAEDGALCHIKAKSIEWVDDDKDEMVFEFEDGSEASLPISTMVDSKDLLWDLLDSKTVGFIPLSLKDGEFLSDISPYMDFKKKHKEGDTVDVMVVDASPRLTFYIVKCGEVFGKINKYYKYVLHKGQRVKVRIYRIYSKSVSFNII